MVIQTTYLVTMRSLILPCSIDSPFTHFDVVIRLITSIGDWFVLVICGLTVDAVIWWFVVIRWCWLLFDEWCCCGEYCCCCWFCDLVIVVLMTLLEYVLRWLLIHHWEFRTISLPCSCLLPILVLVLWLYGVRFCSYLLILTVPFCIAIRWNHIDFTDLLLVIWFIVPGIAVLLSVVPTMPCYGRTVIRWHYWWYCSSGPGRYGTCYALPIRNLFRYCCWFYGERWFCHYHATLLSSLCWIPGGGIVLIGWLLLPFAVNTVTTLFPGGDSTIRWLFFVTLFYLTGVSHLILFYSGDCCYSLLLLEVGVHSVCWYADFAEGLTYLLYLRCYSMIVDTMRLLFCYGRYRCSTFGPSVIRKFRFDDYGDVPPTDLLLVLRWWFWPIYSCLGTPDLYGGGIRLGRLTLLITVVEGVTLWMRYCLCYLFRCRWLFPSVTVLVAWNLECLHSHYRWVIVLILFGRVIQLLHYYTPIIVTVRIWFTHWPLFYSIPYVIRYLFHDTLLPSTFVIWRLQLFLYYYRWNCIRCHVFYVEGIVHYTIWYTFWLHSDERKVFIHCSTTYR